MLVSVRRSLSSSARSVVGSHRTALISLALFKSPRNPKEMPRQRAPEVPQRQSPRGSLHLRVSSSDSDSSRHRPVTDRSPKLGDRRSPRGAQPDSVNQKKLGTRIADLESQIGQAQDELKSLKQQLASAEAAKKEAQEQLQKKAKKKPVSENKERHPPKNTTSRNGNVSDDENWQETDVFEVPVEKEAVNPQIEVARSITAPENETMEMLAVPPLFVEPEKEPFNELAAKDDEINLLKSRLESKDLELQASGLEKDNMKKQLEEFNDMLASMKAKGEEASIRVAQFEEEIRGSREAHLDLKSKLEAVEGEKEALEAEMEKMRVQTEQWRKAADAAAAVLAGDVDIDGRVPARCGSMDKHFNGIFKMSGAGYTGYVGSPADDMDDGYGGGGRRRISGIRMFGDLWKKKPQK
ncbi:hypothetical protein MLD38_012631 [Melastoma candidum]|uniref:Uncharacterized protein n=1 Tax=Melastoma candidum TaxID=119954 RepID=A0ACB9R6Z2_9MYRT|nr:hypothetical protein MLD38_012631 [Melastoma candidum]